MIERDITNRVDLDGVACQLAKHASKIRNKIATSPCAGQLAGLADVAAQAIVMGVACDTMSRAPLLAAIDLDAKKTVDKAAILEAIASLTIPEPLATRAMVLVEHEMQEVMEYLQSIDPRPISSDGAIMTRAGDILSDLYEKFLHHHVPAERRASGAFYTPDPIARFIVRLIDDLLKVDIGFKDGLADPGARVLDPATGTGTFLVHVLDLLHEQGHGEPPGLLGVDLVPVPLMIARIRCNQREARVQRARRCSVVLERGNALDMDPARFSGIPVVLGNPPYARASRNKGTRVDALLDTYKEGVRGDRNIQALSDDYVKFIRLGQDIIDRNGHGIMAYIVNHTFLRGPIFRGMRRSLMASFSKIYVLDLHGNAKIEEDVPPGIVDQNVFSVIQQGTCIVAAIKSPGRFNKPTATVYYHELYGTRQEKYATLDAMLDANGSRGIPWREVGQQDEPPHAFAPTNVDDAVLAEYKTFPSISDIFPFNSVGGKPGDDDLLVSLDKKSAMDKISAFLNGKVDGRVARSRSMTEARRKILHHAGSLVLDPHNVVSYNYRPLDTRYAYYHELAWTRPVSKARQYCHHGNLLLLTTKLVKDRHFNHVFVSRTFTDVIFLSGTSSTNCYLFPVLASTPGGETTWNLSGIYQAYVNRMGMPLDAKDLPGAIGYIYALLWSSAYKERYGSCLKEGAPRVPLVENKVAYRELQVLGKELVSFHLLEHPGVTVDRPAPCTLAGTGLDVVESMPAGRFIDGRLHLNPRRFLHPINASTYGFRVGRYEVLRKWLDARIGITLDAQDIQHVQAMVHVIDRSIDLIREIDKVVKARGVIDQRIATMPV
ncbi:MAG: N-6 DNA methylase [Candidatus Lokiarchaeota archaeon]|nr:N-6 DNA methylase [Candidatus Lokiarchaeota archaeon]